MSKLKKPTSGATPPPIVAAKMQKTAATPATEMQKAAPIPATTSNASKPLPKGVTEETREDLGSHWEKTAGGKVQEMSNQLQKLGLKPSGGGSTEFMNWEEKDKKELKSPVDTREKIGVKNESPIAQHTGADVSGRMQVMEGLKEMYKAADKAGYETADQFRTAYDNLTNATSERNRKLLKDPLLQKQLSNLKEVSAQHFADLIKSRKQSEANKPTVGTVTDMSGKPSTNASYMNRAAYEKAQAPAGIKLSVKKK